MILGRNQFFLLLALLLVGPFYLSKLLWLAHSRKTTGYACFMGHTLELHGDISQHLVILFMAGSDSVFFTAGENHGFTVGNTIPIRYQKNDPSDARIDTPICIWGDTWVNSLLPVMVLLVMYLTPNSFDPLIPHRSRVRLGTKPFIKIIPLVSYVYLSAYFKQL